MSRPLQLSDPVIDVNSGSVKLFLAAEHWRNRVDELKAENETLRNQVRLLREAIEYALDEGGEVIASIETVPADKVLVPREPTAMKAYCESCKKIQPASFRKNIYPAHSGEYEDLCCDECHLIIATLEDRVPSGMLFVSAEWVLEHADNRPDGACRGCTPDGKHLIDNFVCTKHRAQGVLDAPKLPDQDITNDPADKVLVPVIRGFLIETMAATPIWFSGEYEYVPLDKNIPLFISDASKCVIYPTKESAQAQLDIWFDVHKGDPASYFKKLNPSSKFRLLGYECYLVTEHEFF